MNIDYIRTSAFNHPAMQQSVHVSTEQAVSFLETVWYILAEKLFRRVIEVTELDPKREKALREISLRPNDFHVRFHGQKIDKADASETAE